MKRSIQEMFDEAESANSRSAEDWQAGRIQRHEYMVADEFKRLREQWYLGNFVRLYNEVADTKLIFAEHLPECSRPQPDFAVYEESGVLHCHIEVTEWLEHRKRDEEYSRPFREGAQLVGGMPGFDLPNPIDRLRDQLAKKIREKAPSYPSNTWLLIDDNVGLATYPWADRPLGDVEAARVVVDELKTELGNISEVWLLREVSTPMTVHHLSQSICTRAPRRQRSSPNRNIATAIIANMKFGIHAAIAAGSSPERPSADVIPSAVQ